MKPKKSQLKQNSSSFVEKEIFSDLHGIRGTSLFLGRYNMNEVTAALGNRNFFKEAQKRKLWPLDFHLDSSEFPIQRFQIFYKKKRPENMVVDLKIREGLFRPRKELDHHHSFLEYKFLILEWLTLQNPLLSFSPEKHPLPGQKHPGLSLGKKVLDIFVYLAKLTKKDGLLVSPAYYHNALLFLRAFHFINPKKQGEVLAIRKAFPQLSFKQLAWIIHLNCLKYKEGRIYEWKAEEMIFSLNKTLKKYFGSKAYKEKVKETQEKLRFEIDWNCYKRKKQKSLGQI